MPEDVTYPVQVLREHATALEAALSVCLADPGHKPVHRLRTETRRLEAQILLLSQMPELPEHRKDADRLLRALRKLRRAAGVVRDLDVHRRRLEELADEAEEASAAQGNGAKSAGKGAGRGAGAGNRGAASSRAKGVSGDGAKGAGGKGEADGAEQALERGAKRLLDRLDAERDEAAAELGKLLKKQQTKTAAAAEALLEVLKGAEEQAMPTAELLRHAEGVFTREGLLAKGDVDGLGKNDLHSLRKAAKAARYLAETSESPTAERAAERFEELQEAGGQWHDALELTRAARKHLGKTHELTVTMAAERDRDLEQYRKALGAEARPGTEAKTRGVGKSGKSGKRASKPEKPGGAAAKKQKAKGQKARG